MNDLFGKLNTHLLEDPFFVIFKPVWQGADLRGRNKLPPLNLNLQFVIAAKVMLSQETPITFFPKNLASKATIAARSRNKFNLTCFGTKQIKYVQ